MAGLFLAIAAAVSFVHFRAGAPDEPAMVSSLLPPEGFVFSISGTGGGRRAFPALSPDGRRMVFAARAGEGKPQQLYLRQFDSNDARPLPGTAGAGSPFWSPDSRSIAFDADRKLERLDIAGGPPIALADLPGALRGGTWNTNGIILFSTNAIAPLYRVAAAGGQATAVSALLPTDTNGHIMPWFLPDQKHFLFAAAQTTNELEIRVGSLDEPGKPGKIVARASSHAVYADGRLLYLRGGTLMAQPFDLGRLASAGDPIPLAERIREIGSPNHQAVFTVSPTGLLAYQTTGQLNGVRLLWLDRNGRELGPLGDPAETYDDLQLSPDGRSLMAGIETGGVPTLWNIDTRRGVKTRFLSGRASDSTWMPKGDAVIFRQGASRQAANIYRKAANGTGPEELLLEGPLNKYATSVSPDGKVLLYSGPNPADRSTGSDLWLLPLEPGAERKPRPFLQSPFSEQFGKFSPDGKWVAYTSDESGENQIYVMPYGRPGARVPISSGRQSLKPRWRADGKEIFFLTTEGQLMATEVAARGDTIEVGKTQELFGGLTAVGAYLYDVTPDGQKFIVARDANSAATDVPLTLVRNWPALLRR